MRQTSRWCWAPHLLLGGLLIALGVVVFLHNLGVIYLDALWDLWRWWPLLLVFLGLGKFFASGDFRERRNGYWLVVIGLWLLISFFHVFGLSFGESWPLLLVAAGISAIWQSRDDTRARMKAEGEQT
ncbi:MAG: DUF5668 domain-containing protein [candidate division KSB1 bacterium]|nr:DUF5668 domain-containing protein [candidate division KSB1 bacterium]MDZ7275007.1 DUF5668 domain-containing protein [candidate division KSB1 bacterium]MDZ7286544.1 DUF5668 domain-containing protein [candidate division KSB1 bacterium]MDZ7299292.1 DUF5668 domain-containing protein [candidate division KSB1 bacterium]MDZ7307368.1 DUF5668 domain-containing protein [candidate division KSB1 bacterium]